MPVFLESGFHSTGESILFTEGELTDMKSTEAFTEGRILSSLLRFAVPVLFSLFLQALYGGVDLLVVGQFASTSDVSGVAFRPSR